MGVTFFGDDAPDEFGKFDRALITMYRLTAGETWVCPGKGSCPAMSCPTSERDCLTNLWKTPAHAHAQPVAPVSTHDTGTGSRKIRGRRSFRMNDECYPPSSFNNVRKLAS